MVPDAKNMARDAKNMARDAKKTIGDEDESTTDEETIESWPNRLDMLTCQSLLWRHSFDIKKWKLDMDSFVFLSVEDIMTFCVTRVQTREVWWGKRAISSLCTPVLKATNWSKIQRYGLEVVLLRCTSVQSRCTDSEKYRTCWSELTVKRMV